MGCPVAGFHSRYRAVGVGAGQEFAVGAERHPVHAVSDSGGEGLPMGCPVAGFHSRTVPSASALARSLPSGLNATPFTPSRVPGAVS